MAPLIAGRGLLRLINLNCKLTQIVFAIFLCSPDDREIGSEIKLSFDDFAKSHLSNETDIRILTTQTDANGKCSCD